MMGTRLHPNLPFRLFKDVPGSSYAKLPTSTPSSLTRSFTTTIPTLHKSRNYKPRKFVDPWVLRNREQRRLANEARIKASHDRKAAAAGDPIRGATVTTSFVASFDSAIEPDQHLAQPTESRDSSRNQLDVGKGNNESELVELQGTTRSGTSFPGSKQPTMLNHFLTQETFCSDMAAAREFTAPYISTDRTAADPAAEQLATTAHKKAHSTRAEALTRILAPENATARERLLLNKRRCIERFGRHRTDTIFPPKETVPGQGAAPPRERVGPDTGSSEVQIAILTAKIRAVADKYESSLGQYDWVNKRNLRLLLHRRQKLLRYLERQDRGGQRWHHVIETLGLTPATWKGEIEVR